MIKKESYAFPVVVNENVDYFYGGLTKREYFAAMAMQGYIASGLMHGCVENTLAMRSVTAADALIAELNK